MKMFYRENITYLNLIMVFGFLEKKAFKVLLFIQRVLQ